MIKLLRYWNQNKRKILITVAVIALVIIIIQMANNMIKMQNVNNKNEQIKNTAVIEDITKPNQSVVTEQKLTEKETKENSEFIEQFINYCNQKQISEAYSLLGEECKEELYPTQEVFNSNYIAQIFENQVNFELDLWHIDSNCYTYRVTYHKGNLLQTGGKVSNGNFVDYITLIKQNGEYKLNINKLIRKETLNKQASNSGVDITLNSKTIYMDYEIYNITAQNNTTKTILLNGGNASDIKLTDQDNINFYSVISETPLSSLELNAQYKKTFHIKFNKSYITDSKLQEMQITNIYLDKTQYDNKQENAEKTTISIKL